MLHPTRPLDRPHPFILLNYSKRSKEAYTPNAIGPEIHHHQAPASAYDNAMHRVRSSYRLPGRRVGDMNRTRQDTTHDTRHERAESRRLDGHHTARNRKTNIDAVATTCGFGADARPQVQLPQVTCYIATDNTHFPSLSDFL